MARFVRGGRYIRPRWPGPTVFRNEKKKGEGNKGCENCKIVEIFHRCVFGITILLIHVRINLASKLDACAVIIWPVNMEFGQWIGIEIMKKLLLVKGVFYLQRSSIGVECLCGNVIWVCDRLHKWIFNSYEVMCCNQKLVFCCVLMKKWNRSMSTKLYLRKIDQRAYLVKFGVIWLSEKNLKLGGNWSCGGVKSSWWIFKSLYLTSASSCGGDCKIFV